MVTMNIKWDLRQQVCGQMFVRGPENTWLQNRISSPVGVKRAASLVKWSLWCFTQNDQTCRATLAKSNRSLHFWCTPNDRCMKFALKMHIYGTKKIRQAWHAMVVGCCGNFSCGLDESAFIFVAATSKTWISFGNALGKYRQCLGEYFTMLTCCGLSQGPHWTAKNCLPHPFWIFLGCQAKLDHFRCGPPSPEQIAAMARSHVVAPCPSESLSADPRDFPPVGGQKSLLF